LRAPLHASTSSTSRDCCATSEQRCRFAAGGRNRRPPRDPVNSVLSFAYALLTKELVATCIGAGLDPYLGVLHADRFGRPSMALDLAEEFRPLIADSIVVQCFNTGALDLDRDFIRRAGAVQLTKEGRRSVIQAYERRLDATVRHPVFGYTISYRRVLDVQARLLALALTGEIADYTPMVTR
jgi:CRISP-associated protein Cas1